MQRVRLLQQQLEMRTFEKLLCLLQVDHNKLHGSDRHCAVTVRVSVRGAIDMKYVRR